MTVAEHHEAPAPVGPPHDNLAECITLGAMMLSPAMADAITEIVRARDFYRPAHATIFGAIEILLGKGEQVDAALVAEQLFRTEDLVRVGGVPYLHTLIESVPTVANGPHYARTVAEAAVRRRIVEAAVLATAAAQGGGEIADVRESAQEAMFEATTDLRDRAVVTSVGDLVDPVLDEIERAGRGEIEPGIPTGFTDLDRLLGGGLRPGQLVIPAGRTSMGKSVITQNFLWHAAHTTMRPAVLFSVEMSEGEMMRRLLAEVAGVNLSRLNTGQLYDDDRARLADAAEKIRVTPLFLVDTVRTTPGIRSYLRRFRARMGDLVMVGVDYLQELTPVHTGGRRPDRHVEIGDQARDLKVIAQDHAVPMIAPCQLNRGPENRPGKVPGLADMRESGNLEQAADVAILLHRPAYYDKASPRAGEADFIVAKNRNGPTDSLTVAEQLQFSRFRDMPSFGNAPEPCGWE